MKTLPHPCGHCGSSETEDHCQNAQCTWVACTQCRKLTDVKGLLPEE